ncbi:MAG TPA: ATP-binding protein [Ilumatobacteraceae bacterium]|nr:ATP-binding protein [Ilumatobacteraceae bacterium]
MNSHLGLRHDLHAHFGPSQVAVSADGVTVHVSGPVDAGLLVGGFAVVDGEDGDEWTSLVVQIRAMSLVHREGPELDVSTTLGDDDLQIKSATVRPTLRALVGTGVVLGTVGADGFTRRQQVTPFGERLVRPAQPEELTTVAGALDSGAASFDIGVLRHTQDVAARLVAKGFARHTFMCGQSGSGKTYTTGVLFERLLAETTLPIVILDPNSDHIHLGTMADPDDHSEEAERLRSAARSVRVARARGLEASFLLCADFSDLGLDYQALLLRLHPIADADEFDALRRITASLTEPYSVDDVIDSAHAAFAGDELAERVARRIANLGIADWDVWRRGDESSLARVGLRDERCVVLDLGSLARPDERTVVALALLGKRWQLRRDRRPVLIAVDEAHNVLPADTDDPLRRATAELGVLIAGEGRKFGLHLFVATQRPSKVHPNVVSQCDNLVLMRMNGAGDVDDLVSLFSHVPDSMIRSSTGFGLGQALFAGPIAPVPMVVQVSTRRTPEGGGDVPTDWTTPPSVTT